MAEYWDLYDKDRNKLNRRFKRGDWLQDDEYHLVINAWIKNDNNEFLIVQRSENKTYPLMWECVGGSVTSGEGSLLGAVREVKEELGIDILESEGAFIGSTLRYYEGCPDILDIWLFKSNVLISEVEFQKEEVNDAKWATIEEIKKLYKEKKFEANAFFEEVLNR